ncbi:fork head transcription factor Fhl1 [Schizosaccharomyces japonicus yFS275]|uniref:Fork head transcription factor Fhl1 n=1 Tax=Schizosaccharomyces japonicus (strain yFS275 / FY16936) TaxID=402676 RepID=B6K055_SCHJY|nr:fork head transcription factor Fhl1 [Schizosaccharomyces japonicus yFS275]EEB06205.2 fork head transcription factor Fhl1 [Schizosaccharomyces japonicus yFS275]
MKEVFESKIESIGGKTLGFVGKNLNSLEGMQKNEVQNEVPEKGSKKHVQAYAKLEFDNFSFFVQSLQVTIGRKAKSSSHCDLYIDDTKAISREHAKIFYNFSTRRFEFVILGKNGAFVNGEFFEKGRTVPLTNGARIQIGRVPFSFLLPQAPSKVSPVQRPATLSNGGVAGTTQNEKKEPGLLRRLVVPPSKEHFNESNPLAQASTASGNLTPLSIAPEQLRHKEPSSQNLPPVADAIKHSEIATSTAPVSSIPSTASSSLSPSLSKTPLSANQNSITAVKLENTATTVAASGASQTINTPVQYSNGHPGPSQQIGVAAHNGANAALFQSQSTAITKPNLSYASLIARTLIANSNRKMTLNDICEWISDHWLYYKLQPPTWHNSIRHNLSLNKAFIRVPRQQNEPGKGSFWMLDPACIPQFEGTNVRRTKRATTPASVSAPVAHRVSHTAAAAVKQEDEAHAASSLTSEKSSAAVGAATPSARNSPVATTSTASARVSAAAARRNLPYLRPDMQPIILRDGKFTLNPDFFKNANGESQKPNPQALHAIALLQQHITKQLGPAAVNNPQHAIAIANALAMTLAQQLQQQQQRQQFEQQQQYAASKRRRTSKSSASGAGTPESSASPSLSSLFTAQVHAATANSTAATSSAAAATVAHAQHYHAHPSTDPLPPGPFSNRTHAAVPSSSVATSRLSPDAAATATASSPTPVLTPYARVQQAAGTGAAAPITGSVSSVPAAAPNISASAVSPVTDSMPTSHEPSPNTHSTTPVSLPSYVSPNAARSAAPDTRPNAEPSPRQLR